MNVSKTKRGYLVDFYHPIAHERIRKVVRASSKDEARNIAELMRSSLLGGTTAASFGGTTPKKIKEAIAAYKAVRTANKSNDSQVIDEIVFDDLVEVTECEWMSEFSIEDTAKFIRHCRTKRLNKAASINRKLNTLKNFVSWSFQQKWLSEDWSEQIEAVSGPSRESRPLPNEEIASIYCVAGATLRLAMQIAVTWGFRAGEIASLEWPQFNFQNGTVRVGSSGEFSTKSGKSKVLFMTPTISGVLLERRAAATTRYLFPNKAGTGPIDSLRLTRAWARARKRAKAPGAEMLDVRLHDLRATAGTHFAEIGLGDASIARLLGHSTTKMARKYSNKVADDLLRRGVMEAEKIVASVFAEEVRPNQP